MPRKLKRKPLLKKNHKNSRAVPSENNKESNDALNNNNNNSTSVTSASVKNLATDQPQAERNESNNTNKDKTTEAVVEPVNDTRNPNITENNDESVVKENPVDPHINRLFDHIRYSDEVVSVLPNRSWAIHCTEIPVKKIVISEMIMHNAHGRGLEPFYVKQIVFDERLNFELFLLNSRTLLRDKPSFVRSMGDLESVLDYVDSIKLCHGGPDISEYSNVNPECAYKDPYNKWRHNLCLLEINDCDVCEPCVSLEEILKRHTQRKSPLKSRNNNVVKRKRTCL